VGPNQKAPRPSLHHAAFAVAAVLAFFGCFPQVVSGAGIGSTNPFGIVFLTEARFRAITLKEIRPPVPAYTTEARLVPLVAEIEIRKNGRVVSVAILEAPSKDVALMAARAFEEWAIRWPAEVDSDRSIVGRVTYYISVSDGVVDVESPQEVLASRQSQRIERQHSK
jgi:hypothetical protein